MSDWLENQIRLCLIHAYWVGCAYGMNQTNFHDSNEMMNEIFEDCFNYINNEINNLKGDIK